MQTITFAFTIFIFVVFCVAQVWQVDHAQLVVFRFCRLCSSSKVHRMRTLKQREAVRHITEKMPKMVEHNKIHFSITKHEIVWRKTNEMKWKEEKDRNDWVIK